MAIYAYGTDYNSIYIGEVILGTIPTSLGLMLIYKKTSANNS